MNREEAYKLLKENLFNNNLLKHCLAVEAIMRGLAQRLGGEIDKWGIVGLLHDIDYEKTKDDTINHSLVGAEMLKNLGFENEIVEAIKTHNEAHNIPPDGMMAKSLFTCDPMSGLIVASVLVLPSKKIAELSADNVLNRFKEKAFARGANREIIKQCEPLLGLSLEELTEIALKAMKEISEELEL
jgi:putative nucleotidyltransferase with HDIG domain